MKCFYHQEKEAIAICKNCSRGLCSNCVAEVTNGVACKGKCEDDVIFLNKMLQKNKTILNKTASSYYRVSAIYLVMGIAFIIFGLNIFTKIPPLQYFMWTVGGIMFFAAILTFISGKKFNNK